jgi:hypothetical protein
MLSILTDTTGFFASGGGTYLWEEEQANVKTNAFGLFTVVFGNPLATKKQGSAASFSAIDWAKTPLYIGTKIANPTSYKNMGSAKLWSVPYSMVTDSTKALLKGSKLSVVSSNDLATDALFEVKRKDGQTVFAVYPDAVNIYVPRTAKGTKGGFAIGGFDQVKLGPQDYFRVTPDSVRIYINDLPGKSTKGGFAIGGFDQVKGTKANFFNVETSSTGIINPSQNRVLWYPIKNAFLTGRVKIENPDSVGINSFASGYESKAKGQYSQAMGYKTIARGDFSTAIGKNAIVSNKNSFAFGDSASASGLSSYAFGTYAKATGDMSFALGSVGVDSLGKKTGQTVASGFGAFAAGFGSVASGQGAFTLGVSDTASGPFSTAFGYLTSSKGVFSTTMGLGTLVEPYGWNALAAGVLTKAGNWAAVAFGDKSYASGHTSFATGYKTIASGHLSSSFGEQTVAQSKWSMVIGGYNVIAGDPYVWYAGDPLFVIGNGTSLSARSNALTVYKNGNMDLSGLLNKNLIAPESLELNYGGTGNRFSLIDFHSDDTYTDFSFRILRNTGLNGSSDIIHRGIGTFDLITEDNAPITFSTWNSERMRIKSNGFVGINTSNPVYMLDVAGSVNLNKNLSGGLGAIYVNGDEALWYNGTYFSWGYGGIYNAFADKVSVGTTANPGSYSLYVNGSTWSTGGYGGSDIRWKKNITGLEQILEKILQLNGISYDWRKDEFPDIKFDTGRQIGLIAQDVEKVFPELVKTDNSGYKAVSYEKLSVLLLEGMKEQQKIIDTQKSKISDQDAELKSLKARVEQIEVSIAKSESK